MIFNTHSTLVGEHAFLSPSKHHWINYDDEKLDSAYLKYLAVQRGTVLHDFARRCIELSIKLPKTKRSLNQYVNDAIGYRMTPEQLLFYSENSFGTADAISFREGILRIHDLKTGISPVSIRQLEVYAALFCLEYKTKPDKIAIELRLYHVNDIIIAVPDTDDIYKIMAKIVAFDKRIAKLKSDMEE